MTKTTAKAKGGVKPLKYRRRKDTGPAKRARIKARIGVLESRIGLLESHTGYAYIAADTALLGTVVLEEEE